MDARPRPQPPLNVAVSIGGEDVTGAVRALYVTRGRLCPSAWIWGTPASEHRRNPTVVLTVEGVQVAEGAELRLLRDDVCLYVGEVTRVVGGASLSMVEAADALTADHVVLPGPDGSP